MDVWGQSVPGRGNSHTEAVGQEGEHRGRCGSLGPRTGKASHPHPMGTGAPASAHAVLSPSSLFPSQVLTLPLPTCPSLSLSTLTSPLSPFQAPFYLISGGGKIGSGRVFASSRSRSDVSGNLCFCLSVDQWRERGPHRAERRRQRGTQKTRLLPEIQQCHKEAPTGPPPQSSSSFHSLQLQEAVITSPPHYDKAQTQRDGAPCPRSLSSQAGFEPRSLSIQSLGFPTSCGSLLLDTELKDLQRARSPLLEKCKQTDTHTQHCL